MTVSIEEHSGFCGGVIRAIRSAERHLEASPDLYCLGEIVHNEEELGRLASKGLKYVSLDEVPESSSVLIRAHGEPPRTYSRLREKGCRIIDCTCPAVLNVQKSIREVPEGARVIIFGKKGHPEVMGLVGQLPEGRCCVVQDSSELERELSENPLSQGSSVELFSQTTMDPSGYDEVIGKLRAIPGIALNIHNTICAQVTSRHSHLRSFAASNDVIVFVSGKSSSNGNLLCNLCRSVNPRTYLVSGQKDLLPEWFAGAGTVGVCGATSTPQWLLEDVASQIENLQ